MPIPSALTFALPPDIDPPCDIGSPIRATGCIFFSSPFSFFVFEFTFVLFYNCRLSM